MKQFADLNGRTWAVRVDVGAMKRLQAVGINLTDLAEDTILKLFTDPIFLGDVLWHICKPAADAAQVSEAEFASGLAGDVLEAARTALVDALIQFQPRAGQREALQRALEATDETITRAYAAVAEQLKSTDFTADVDAVLQNAMKKEPVPAVGTDAR